MNENLEELKKLKENFSMINFLMSNSLKMLSPILEDFEKRLIKLEQRNSYYLTDEELLREKIGGTD